MGKNGTVISQDIMMERIFHSLGKVLCINGAKNMAKLYASQ